MRLYYLTFIATLFFFASSYSQDGNEMAYRFGFRFLSKKMSNKGKFYLVTQENVRKLDTVGSFTLSGSPILITKINSIDEDAYTPKLIGKNMKGVVKERNKDTLFIKFWSIIGDDPFADSSGYVNKSINGKEFIYVIDSTKWDRNKSMRLRFGFNQIVATSLPFRVLTNTGKLESDFLNANVAALFIRGNTKIFKSEFIKSRNRYFGFGPYVGLSSIDNPVTSDKQFGLNYGVNGVLGLQGFNITFAYGFQNGFKRDTRMIQPYLGFGIGFKLLETFSPEIKNKDE